MEVFRDRCSICFEHVLDISLNGCRDQFCSHCFQRYVKEVVESAWGLGIVSIKCPVCKELIPKREWQEYVDDETVSLYEKYNQSFKRMSTLCPHCNQINYATKSQQPQQWNDDFVVLKDFLKKHTQMDINEIPSLVSQCSFGLVYEMIFKERKEISQLELSEASSLFIAEFCPQSQWSLFQARQVSLFPFVKWWVQTVLNLHIYF